MELSSLVMQFVADADSFSHVDLLLFVMFTTCNFTPPREEETWLQSYLEKHSPSERAP